jgi:hypothetical protein
MLAAAGSTDIAIAKSTPDQANLPPGADRLVPSEQATGLRVEDLIVNTDGTITRAVKPSTAPMRRAECNPSNCTSSLCQ